MSTPTRNYGVKLIRGPFVRLEPHAEHCANERELVDWVAALRRRDPGVRLAADLFSGAGGMSLGLEQAGFRVVFSADHDPEAVETHAHHFGGMSVDWDLADADAVERVAATLRAVGVELLAGGPPCQPFSKAGRSKIRDRVRRGLRDPHDQRRDLWRSYLEVVRLAEPKAVIMENVPDMALDREMFIFRSIVEELEQLGYSVEGRVLDCRAYGIPQFRQRLIIVALRNGHVFEWPAVAEQTVNVWNAIGDLPEVEGGWRPAGGADGWADYAGPVTEYQRLMRQGILGAESARLYDHITRPVREDDAIAFEHMDHETRYSELPESAQRYRTDIFHDKYKRLDENHFSRTITAHIAKDGYWYIHPRQGRTITIREAARLQSFPDWFRFAGPPSAAFRQIGNAVPPLLAKQLGECLAVQLAKPVVTPSSSRQIGRTLAMWFAERERLAMPWLKARTTWQVVVAETLLDRLPTLSAQLVWPSLSSWATPEAALAGAEELREVAAWVGRDDRVDRLLRTAARMVSEGETQPAQLASSPADDASSGADLGPDEGAEEAPAADRPGHHAETAASVPRTVLDLALLVVPSASGDGEEPVIAGRGLLRLARRFFGDEQILDRQNRLTDGRIAVARLIGGADSAREAHLGLIELATSLCTTGTPACGECPLRRSCVEGSSAP
ncbi:DNA cytosine methyltransferase [Geodermatophilus obscurus]|uniref:Cytosine-specific methyltransferase n=1 Tax=Geodermatophilus obscurus (strain ATCC 25078 / DSM 43160 / JCM 3152 / CCUG 61914 / KCC A-0152 / KCTC 9177 / NBRC 13315 / NRRL B-3577 / G-20) TaxID=526225 RepID=D2S8A3_GEOOG|nr:DNA cytosine methyltransferase [Geodermatophilus obscurus]ADB73525.1 DNA-cytosine methyltransferase [Geodermatophilus obscurus DSM 43160]